MNMKADTYNIRPVRMSDAARLAEIYNYYIVNTTVTLELEPITADEMARRISEISAFYPYFVYEKDGNILGYTYAHPWKTRAGYQGHSLETTVYLDVEARHMGIGRLLVEHLEETCRKAGYHVLIAYASDENKDSLAMHERLGFKQVAHYEEVGRKFDRWIGINSFEKKLDTTDNVQCPD